MKTKLKFILGTALLVAFSLNAFAAIIEPYAGEPFIISTRLADVADNEADARRAVAVEVQTAVVADAPAIYEQVLISRGPRARPPQAPDLGRTPSVGPMRGSRSSLWWVVVVVALGFDARVVVVVPAR